MNRARIAFTAMLAISSMAVARPAQRWTAPLPLLVTLCEREVPDKCRSRRLPAGQDLREFVDASLSPHRTYHLRLELPPGNFELQDTWQIDGDELPAQIEQLSIAGAPTRTRLTGARNLAALGARLTVSGNSLSFDLPAALRDELKASSYTAADPAWPQLRDAQGSLQLTSWPRMQWATFEQSAEAAAAGNVAAKSAPLAAWRDESSAWVWGFFKFGWHAEYAPLSGIDALETHLRLGGSQRDRVGTAGRFRVLNLRSELRSPGDYWIDTTHGRITLFPRGSTAPEALRLTLLSAPLMRLHNVRAVGMRAITFSETRGHALVIENGEDVELSALGFENIGRAGLVVAGGHNVHIRDSTFDGLGDQAIILRGGERSTLTASGHRVEHCHIRRASQRLNTPATAIRLEGVGHSVKNNFIEDAPHSAIYFDGNDHLIEGNWIERVCLEVEDAGAIYGGRDWTARGTRIRGNVFSQIRARSANGVAVGVYLDDMLSGIQVEDNTFVDVSYGILVGGGRDNVITRNLFFRAGTSLHVDERALTWAWQAVAPGDVMDQRLRAMPVKSPRWKSAYPGLAGMARDRAPIPEGNQVRDNLAAQSGTASLVGIAAVTGVIEPPRNLELPATVRTAAELLEFCRTARSCQPFQPPVDAARNAGY